MDFYTDLGEIPIYNFYKCMQGELKYMFPDRNTKVFNTIKSEWNKMYNEYCLLTINNAALRYYRLVSEIKYLKERKLYVPILLDTILKTPIKDIDNLVKEVNNWKIPFNKNKDLKTELEKAIKILNNSDNKINRKEAELESIINKPTTPMSLEIQKVHLHKALGLDINTKTTSVLEWLSYWNELKKQKQWQ